MGRRFWTSLTLLAAIGMVIAAIIIDVFFAATPDENLVVVIIAVVAGVLGLLASFRDIMERRSQVPAAEAQRAMVMRSPAQTSIEPVADSALTLYRVAVLEGYVNWMLNNGKFVRDISSEEIDEIRARAGAELRESYPDARVVSEHTGGAQ